jgi:ATP/maltotriose-dependent transcriptional regulator MalT
MEAALHMHFILMAASRGDWESMKRRSELACDETRYGQTTRSWRLNFVCFQARACWHSGDIEGLRRVHATTLVTSPAEAPPTVVHRALIRGMLAMAERAYAQAEQAFREALAEEEAFQITRSTCSARVMLAYTLLARGRVEESMEVLAPYLAWCAEENLPGRMMHENPLIQPLLRQALEHKIQRPFVERVLEMLGAPLTAAAAAGGEALSDREMDVLRVMAEGLGNREIGERLFVSEATVKTHVQRILRKLDAASRTQAVTRARELMLI